MTRDSIDISFSFDFDVDFEHGEIFIYKVNRSSRPRRVTDMEMIRRQMTPILEQLSLEPTDGTDAMIVIVFRVDREKSLETSIA